MCCVDWCVDVLVCCVDWCVDVLVCCVDWCVGAHPLGIRGVAPVPVGPGAGVAGLHPPAGVPASTHTPV